MKQVAFIFFTIFLLLNPGFIVHSQNTDPCENNDINFNDVVNFDTTAMSCQLVWKDQGYTLRYAQAGSDVWSFLLSAPAENCWIAVGFSTNGMMAGSSAMVGWVYQNGTAIGKQYFLKSPTPNQVLPDQGELVLMDNSTTVFQQSSRIYLAFQLNTAQPRTKLLYAVGPYGQLPITSNGLKLTEHRDKISTTLDYSTGKSQAQNSPYTGLRRTHGALNMLGWGILMPIGAMVARYFRQWDPIWFYSHTAIQILGFLFGLVAFILGFVLNGFINARVEHHKNLGIVILLLGCLQASALLIRPQKGSKLRKYWNWYHHNAGRILIIFVISNIFYGISLGMEGPSWYGTYAAILAILVIVAIVLEIRLRKQR